MPKETFVAILDSARNKVFKMPIPKVHEAIEIEVEKYCTKNGIVFASCRWMSGWDGIVWTVYD